MFHRIAPVGNPISLKSSDTLPTLLDNSRIKLVQSGTAALAAAIAVAKKFHAAIERPEVIIPAYCCPDVVTAVVFNGAKPVLVDFIPNRPYMDLDGIKRAITKNTIALVAVNFLGIPERCKKIRAAIAPHDLVLIEDSAQWFPEQGDLFSSYEGDITVVSFGKGKPISLLGGGAVVLSNSNLQSAFDQLQVTPSVSSSIWKQKILFGVYNAAIHPLFYWVLELLPFIKMGTTRYKQLASIVGIDPTKSLFLYANVASYRQRAPEKQRQLYAALQASSLADLSLAHQCESYAGQTLLRFPILLSSPQQRERLLSILKAEGFGASDLYGVIVKKIAGVEQHLNATQDAEFANAADLAARLITLPTHNWVADGLAFRRAISAIQSVHG